MRVTRNGVSKATINALPIVLGIGIVSGIDHHDTALRILVLVVILVGPFVGLPLLLSLSSDRRFTGRTLLKYGLLLFVGVGWSLSLRTLADMRAIPQSGRFAFTLQTVAVLALIVTGVVGARLWLESWSLRSK